MTHLKTILDSIASIQITTLARRATVGPHKRNRHDDAGCPERGRPCFLCWIKTTRLRESKPSPAGEMKEA
jgi:hypothetical protein